MQPRFTHGGKGKLSEMTIDDDMRYWMAASPEDRVIAAFKLSQFCYEVNQPGRVPARLDRTVGGVRRRGH